MSNYEWLIGYNSSTKIRTTLHIFPTMNMSKISQTVIGYKDKAEVSG